MTAKYRNQTGLTLIEMLVSLLLAMSVMAGAIQIFLQIKNNFIAASEMAVLQENARFAFKLFRDEIHMAGYNSCGSTARNIANSIIGASGNWALDGTGIQGYEHEAGIGSFPGDISADVLPDTDALVVRRGESPGYLVSNHAAASSTFKLQAKHAMEPGDIVLVATPDCAQLGYFQAVTAADDYITHAAGNLVSPGNCTGNLAGAFSCEDGTDGQRSYPPGSILMKLASHAYYVGPSEVSEDIPALFRERLGVVTNAAASWSEELIQGVENMQVRYGIDIDRANSSTAIDTYIKADDERMDWEHVISVQISLRLRSLRPVYQQNVPYAEFMGIEHTGGADRFMRETFSTTISLRN